MVLKLANVSVERGQDYYLERVPGLENDSRWLGQAAAQLGLRGAVDDQLIFNRILKGKSPGGRKGLYQTRRPLHKRRAAVDCTFCAPKSLSLQALVQGDTDLIEAHREAVNHAISLIEKEYLITRLTHQGLTQSC